MDVFCVCYLLHCGRFSFTLIAILARSDKTETAAERSFIIRSCMISYLYANLRKQLRIQLQDREKYQVLRKRISLTTFFIAVSQKFEAAKTVKL
jgi:hypothetical protein